MPSPRASSQESDAPPPRSSSALWSLLVWGLGVRHAALLGCALWCVWQTLGCPAALAQDDDDSVVEAVPKLRPPVVTAALDGKPVLRIEVVTEGGRWDEEPTLRNTRAGEPFSAALGRRAARELSDTGRFASVKIEAYVEGGGVVLRLRALPRRIVTAIRVAGGALDEEEMLGAARLEVGGEITAPDLPRIASRIKSFYARRGFGLAAVKVDAVDTDERMQVVVRVEIEQGGATSVIARKFLVDGSSPKLMKELEDYQVEPGDRADQELLHEADAALQKQLRQHGWHRAEVSHRLQESGLHMRLLVSVKAGPLFRLRFEGNRHFDADQLTEALDLEETEDRSLATLERSVKEYYVDRGFLDVRVKLTERGEAEDRIHDLVFRIHEGRRVKVVSREFPCLTGERDADDVGAEIDSFLSEELPGGGLFGSVDPARVDETLGPKATTGSRVAPMELTPYQTYQPDVYERAIKHVRDLYRSEGYLAVTVGPAVLLRRQCARGSPPGRCRPVGPRPKVPTQCVYDERGLPLDEPEPEHGFSCVPDPARGIECEADVVLHIPIKLGPRSVLYDVAFEGNRLLVEKQLEEIADVELGGYVSQVELDKAKRRVLDAYAEEGFAYAEAETILDLSPDRTRARVRFVISEGERVIVSGITVRGARHTQESLILGRVALEKDQPYRRSKVRQTEERLATLGVFSSINVSLEDPYVPAKRKRVVITVQERLPQYLEVRPGFGTGEGFRITFEYGHRNLGGRAIQLTLRSQLSLLPSTLIFDDQVREKIDQLPLGKRLERRNTVSLEFPEIGLGPLFRLGIDGIEVNDLAREFLITKRAGVVTLIYRPNRQFSAQLGQSVELNDAEILGFDAAARDAFVAFLRTNPIPEGESLVVAQRVGVTWDRRDIPFGATRGTLVSGAVEHARAFPLGNTQEKIADFLRFSNRLAGYIPLNDKGLAFATSFAWGYNHHLIPDRQTYPDRLFFFGGIDSIRGFLQDSVVPQDVADELLAVDRVEQDRLLREVVLRGGNLVLNPRAELRIPLGDVWSTALFVDSGNLWLDPMQVRPFVWRYSAGSGLRANTPIGPLAFDYGINLDRRPWEDFGAFHFSVGLF